MLIRSKLLLAIIFSSALVGAVHGDGIVNGGSGGSGTVTSIATTCGAAGGPIATTGTIKANETPSSQTGANYAFQDSDCGKLINLSNGSNQIPTMAAAGSGTLLFAAGGFVDVCNQGAGTQTLTPTTSTIGGASTYVLAAGSTAAPKCITVVSDGVNYQVIPYAGPVTASQMPAFSGGDCTSSAGSVSLLCLQGTLGIIAGNYYTEYFFGVGRISTAASIVNTIRCHTAYFKNQSTIDQLGARIGTGTASGNFTVAIYAISAATGKPTGSALVSTGSLSTTTAGLITGSVSQQLGSAVQTYTPYGFCLNSDATASTTTTFSSINADSFFLGSSVGTPTSADLFGTGGTSPITGWTTAQTCCTWPSLTSATWTDANGVGQALLAWHVNTVP